MTDFSAYLADLIVDWFSQDTQFPTPPSDLYVTLFDGAGNELDGQFANARAAVSTSTGWTKNGTEFENTNAVDLGEAASEVTDITHVALYDAATGGNELARYEIDQAPFNVASGSILSFEAGELSFDVVDTSE